MKRLLAALIVMSVLLAGTASLAEGPGGGRGGRGGAGEHMTSFDYAYRIEAVRDWLFEQE